ncbi:hypothetical protein Tco_0268166 [Tanacetum coccineum]
MALIINRIRDALHIGGNKDKDKNKKHETEYAADYKKHEDGKKFIVNKSNITKYDDLVKAFQARRIVSAAIQGSTKEEISPTILEAAKTLSKVASQSVSKAKSTDKGKRNRRRARSMVKNINTGLDTEEEINTNRAEINTGIEDVNTGSTKVDTGRTSISTSSIVPSLKKGQREGKAQMVEEDIQATHKTKEQIRQEKVGLEETIRLQAQMDEEVAKQIHLDKMIAKRV